MRLIQHILLLALLLTGFSAFSQGNLLGAENIPNNKQFDWKSIASPSFDIYYYASDPQMAAVAAKMAEEGLWDICKGLDYANRSRFSIYIYLSPEDYAQSNAYPSPNFKDNGLTPLYPNSANVIFPGNYQAFRGKVRAAVSKVLMEDYYFGGTIQGSIQNTVLLSMPDWYADGLPSFMGEGWTYEDEFWLAGLEKADMLDIALDGEGPIHRVARKSIWLYITDTYGPEKLGEIFYMTRLTRSVEDGVIHVLGITLKTLTDRWREYVHQKLADDSNFREQLEPYAQQADLSQHDRLISFAQHPKEPKAAIFLENKGKTRLAIYDFNKKRLEESPVEGGYKTEQLGTMSLDRPIAWKPDGSQLVTVTNYKGQDYLAWYTPLSGKVKYSKISPALDRVFQIAWSPGGEHLVCSGLRMGSIDLYRFGPETANFVQLTNDFYDDLNPVWSQDGQRIYFASTRPSTTTDQVGFDANRRGYDIWAYELEGESLSQITHSPLQNEWPVGMQSSFELLVNADQTGLFNLQRVNVFLGDSSYVSNHFPGTFRPSLSDSFLAYATSFEGKLVLWSVKTSNAILPQVATRSMWRQKQDKAMMLAKQKSDLNAALDSIRKANANLPKPVLEPTEADTAKETKTVKYYVFDDDDDQAKERKRNRKSTGEYVPKPEPSKPDFNEVELKGPGRTGHNWVADRITTRFSYDPVFKLSFLGESRIRDLEGDYQIVMGFRPYVDFKSADAYLGFLNQAHKIDYALRLTRSTRYLSKLEFGSRYNATRLDFDASLPFNRFWSLGGGSHLALLERRNVTLQLPRNVDGSEFVAGASLNLRYDHRKMNGNFSTKGSYANFRVQAVNSISQDSNRFATASFDLRKYIPVKKFVLATRVQGAWSLGSMPQQFFLGGIDEALFSRFSNPADFPIESAQLPRFHYMEYVTPIRGFRFNGRNGTKFVAANAELRIPASRVFRNFLNTNPLYSLELIPFFDFGTTWTTGNPLSQKNPIETQVVNSYPLAITVQTLKSPFLMGFGAGARLQVFGYSTRIDLAWGVDDYTILSPKLHLSLGKNF